jgi:hypothetical protein
MPASSAERDPRGRLWLLTPDGDGHTRLITRLRSRYAWARPTIPVELILMEVGDPFMMPGACSASGSGPSSGWG